jgi:hypothetical protein
MVERHTMHTATSSKAYGLQAGTLTLKCCQDLMAARCHVSTCVPLAIANISMIPERSAMRMGVGDAISQWSASNISEEGRDKGSRPATGTIGRTKSQKYGQTGRWRVYRKVARVPGACQARARRVPGACQACTCLHTLSLCLLCHIRLVSVAFPQISDTLTVCVHPLRL